VNRSIKSRKLLVPLPLAIFICSWFLLCVSSFMMAGFFNFVPSAEWLAETNLLRTIAGALSAALFVWVFWKGGRRLGVSKLKQVVFTDLETEVRSGLKSIDLVVTSLANETRASIAALSTNLAERNKPQWQALGVALTFAAMLDGLAYLPVPEATSDLSYQVANCA
jgi:hypothetical protein